MGIEGVSAVGGGGRPALGSGKERFGEVLERMEEASREPGPRVATESAPRAAPENRGEAPCGASRVEEWGRAAAGQAEARMEAVQSTRVRQAVRVLERVSEAQERLDRLLGLAESGRSFTPAELLAFQAHAYRASQELDLAGKVVEKATGGVKQVLQTQL